MIPPNYAVRAAELAGGITAIAARLPRDWPKEHPVEVALANHMMKTVKAASNHFSNPKGNAHKAEQHAR